jgi:hypothetical protein
MATTIKHNDPNKLYHSPITGEFNCGEHAPHRKTDTWWRDRWRKVTARDHAGWPVEELGPIACEVCKSIAKRAAENGTTDGGVAR